MKMKKSLALLLTLAMLFGMVSSLSTVVTSAAPVLEEYESSTFIEKYTFNAVDYYRHADWMVLYTSKFNAYTDYEANKSKYADINKAWFSYHYSEAACKGRTATNQYGTEVIINPYGIVTEIQLNVGNAEIPRGGMVISGNGTASTWLRDNVKVGDCIVARDSSGDGIHDYFDVFRTTKDSKYTADSKACQFNKKYTYVDTNGETKTVSTVTITEGGAGVRTGTNEWNNDVLVKATGKGNDGIANHAGYVVKFGGNNIEVPEGYFALSFSGQTMHDTGLPSYNGSYLFQQYAAPGAIVNIGSSEVFFRYDAAAAKRGAYLMTGLTDSDISVDKVETYSAKAILEDAKKNFELVDVDAMQALYDNMVAAAQAMNNSSYTTKAQVEKYHATINKNYEALCALEYEKRSVEMRAVWIRPLPNDGVIRSEKELDKLLEDAVLEQKKLGYNQIFIEAFYNSCTVFPVPADAGYKTLYYSQNPYLVPDEMTCGSAGLPGKNTKLTEPYDMLQKFIDICKENDIEPHIWWEVFYVGYKRTNGMTDSLFDYSIAKQIMNNSSYSTWLNKGSNGDLFYGAEADGALQYFLSPANDDAREFLLKTFKYIWTTYDDVVSFQLDYIRYPGTTSVKSFGYDTLTMDKFKASEYYNSSKHTDTYLKSLTASDNTNNTGAYDPQWVQFRANLVTTFIEEVRSEMATVAPGLYLSASPDPEMAAAKKLKMQDVEYWLNHDLIDILYPMAYGENVPGMVAPELVENNPKHFVCVGTAASYNSDDYEARWLKEVRDAGADGIAGFGTIDSWKNYAWSIDAVSPIGNASRAGRVYAMDTVCDRADQMLKLGAITAAQCALIKEKAAIADEAFRLTGIESADSLYAINALQTVADGLSSANAKAALTKDVNYLLKIRNNSKDVKKQATELKESDFTLGVNGETYSNAQTAATYIAGSNTLYVKENGTVLSGSTLGYVTVLAKEGVSKLEFNRVTFSAGNGLLQGNGIEASAPLTIELTGKNTVTAETLSNVTCKYMGTGQLYNGDELVVFMGDIVDNKKLDSDDIRAMMRANVKATSLTSKQEAIADANGDGKINSIDTRMFLEAYIYG